MEFRFFFLCVAEVCPFLCGFSFSFLFFSFLSGLNECKIFAWRRCEIVNRADVINAFELCTGLYWQVLASTGLGS